MEVIVSSNQWGRSIINLITLNMRHNPILYAKKTFYDLRGGKKYPFPIQADCIEWTYLCASRLLLSFTWIISGCQSRWQYPWIDEMVSLWETGISNIPTRAQRLRQMRISFR